MVDYSRDDEELKRAVERLLVWGFEPACIAKQLCCSVNWVEQVREEREAFAEDAEELMLSRLTG